MNAVKEKELLSVSHMLIYGANINAMIEGNTVLHYSANLGNELLVEFLLQHDSQPNLLNADECTPLDLAIMQDKKLVIELLLSRGAERNLISMKVTRRRSLPQEESPILSRTVSRVSDTPKSARRSSSPFSNLNPKIPIKPNEG